MSGRKEGKFIKSEENISTLAGPTPFSGREEGDDERREAKRAG